MKIFLRTILLVSCFYVPNLISAQKLKIGRIDKPFEISIDSTNNRLWFLQSDSLLEIELNAFKITNRFKIANPILDTYKPLIVNNSLYIVNDEGGEVYIWKNNQFERIDSSYTHKMQVGSSLIVYNNEIYRYGGYGFWSCRNFFTIFNELKSDWEIENNSSEKNLPEGTFGSYYKINDDVVYLFGGEQIKHFRNHNTSENPFVYRYDIENKRWLKPGSLNTKLSNKQFVDSKDSAILIGKTKVYSLHFSENRFTAYALKQAITFIGKTYFNKDYFYITYEELNPDCTNELYIKKIPKTTLIGEKLNSGAIFNTTDNILYYSIILGLIIVGLGITLIVRNRVNKRKQNPDKVIIHESTLSYKDKVIDISTDHSKIINLLITKKEVTTSELFELIHKDHLHISHLSRILNTYLEELNFKLQLLTQTKNEFIFSEKSDKDKRIKIYSIDKKWF